MQTFSLSLKSMFTTFWFNRALIKTLTQREILGRYRGSFIGIFWSFFNPLIMLAVYTFVFSIVFKARWTLESDSKMEFALLLFAGLLIFNLFAECISRAPGLVVTNANYVKKVVFPLEVLPIVNLFAALFHLIVSLGVWLLTYIIFFGVPYATVLTLPLILLPFLFFVMGLSWILASLGVFLRDISQLIGIVITVLMFLSPVFYPVTSLPEIYQWFFMLNPLTPVIEMTRDVLFWNKYPNFYILFFYSLAALIVAYLGFAWFQMTRKGFADVV